MYALILVGWKDRRSRLSFSELPMDRLCVRELCVASRTCDWSPGDSH